ncbi:hypothetical protein BKI52_29410 [marine bacterium AO1-C]|nr:hypothetical protein BKI52_29410 [marine bacterium AO1-C]
MDYIDELRKTMAEHKLIFMYEGEFTQDIILSLLRVAEKKMNALGENLKVTRKVFNVMTECLQNIVKYSDAVSTDNGQAADSNTEEEVVAESSEGATMNADDKPASAPAPMVVENETEAENEEESTPSATEIEVFDPLFMIGRRPHNQYAIATGNIIKNEKIEKIQERLEHINGLDKFGLLKYYQQTVKANMKRDKNKETDLDRNSAGLGFIDMARKSGNKFGFDFKSVNDEFSYFYFLVTV